MSLQFLSLASGSSGNCYYLGNEEYGILIDIFKARCRIAQANEYHMSVFFVIKRVIVHTDTEIDRDKLISVKYGYAIQQRMKDIGNTNSMLYSMKNR